MTRILLIDNYDSFTYNLVHYLQELGAEVEVKRNDALTTVDIAKAGYDGIVISPGPGRPEDAGISEAVIRELGPTIPIFGVCLGHQAIGQVYGGKVVRGASPMHGKISALTHKNIGIFKNIPSPFNATRYHSLIVDRSTLPACLEVTAETADGTIMGLQHKEHPVHGVQFHPESIASEHGHQMLGNFLTLCREHAA
ncbi:aminodeoxychorismate/anthranilate synthase component II [bacterium]|nr:aminodeoxychorismate/anthranilate synthase component II [bacterium]